jgi:N-acetylneuraminate lyase
MTVFPKTHGLIAAAVTPMLPDGSIHYDLIKQQALLLQRNKLFGAFICGTTGEGLSLTLAERENIAETWSAVKAPGFRLIVHVGHDCLSDAKRLARHAEQINADAIAALAPVFFKPDGLDALAAWFSDLAGATRLPIYYYHFPHMTGITVLMHEFLQAVRHVPNCAGV